MASSHPISLSLQKAYGQSLDRDAVHNIEEIAGHGIRGTVHGHDVYAGNEKLMNKIGVDITEKHPEGTVVYMAIDNQYAGCIVISDVANNNVSSLKQIVVAAEDNSAGIVLYCKEDNDTYMVGDKVEVRVKDLSLENYRGLLELNGVLLL